MGMTVETLMAALHDSGDWVDAQTLAELSQVTPRTVRNYVRKVNEGRAEPIIESSHRGYRIRNKDVGPTSSKEQTTFRHPKASRENRLLALLLTRKGKLSIYDLADELHVSESTFQATLRSLRPRIAENALSLRRERDSVWLDGTERSKRKLIGRVLREGQLPEFLAPIVKTPEGKALISREAVRSALFKYNLACNDFGIDNLMAHLEIMANRIATGSTIHGDDESNDEETSVRALHASNEICDLVSARLEIAIDSAERAYVALVIDTNTQSLEIQADERPESSSISPLDLRIARESAEQLTWNYCLEGFSEEFIQRLAAHIHLLRRRAFHGMEVPNPLAHRVKADYPLIYDMAVKIANIIEGSTKIAVSENEIAFLAFHVGGYLSHSSQQQKPIQYVALYHEYHGLQEHFVNRVCEIIGHRAELILAERVAEWRSGQIDCDLVITPTPIITPDGIKQLVIGPIVSDQDEDKLRETVDALLQERRGSSTAAILRRFINPSLIRFNLPVEDSEEAIHLLASDSIRRGLVGENFEQEVLDRERLSTTAFNNLVAIPHTLNPSAIQPFLHLIINKQPIAWGDQHVNLVVLLGIPPHERESFTNIYVDLLSALIDPLNVAALLESTSYEDVIARLDQIVRHERKR